MAIDWGQFNQGLQTASPMLLGLGQQLLGNNDQGLMQGVAAMQENAQRAKRKAAIDSLKSEMGLDPTQIALMEAMGPEAAVGWMADEYRTRQGQSALDSFWAAMNGGDTYAPPQAGPAGLDMGPIQTENIEDAEFRQDWLAAMEGAPGVEQFHAIPDRLMADLQRDLGLTQAQAAGVVGNLAAETGDFQHMQEINPVVKGSRGGFGYAQWTGPRRRQYEAWAQENGLDPTSYEANYGFLVHELTATPESRVMGDLTRAKTPEQAAQIFSEQFLRPGVPHMDRRKANAARYAGGQPSNAGGQRANRTEQALREMLSNPYIPDAQKQYAIAEYQRRFGQTSRYHKLTAQEVAQLGLPDGAYQMGPDGKISKIGGGGQTINVGPTGIDYGEPGKGLVWQRDAAGNVVIDERGAPVAIPYQGGEVWQEQQAASQVGAAAAEQTATQADSVLNAIGDIEGMLASSGPLDILPEVGIIGNALATMGLNQEAVDLSNSLQTVQSAEAFSRLQAMRDASPTGGALGSISERELGLLQESLTALQQSSGKAQFERNLQEVKRRYSRILAKAQLYQGDWSYGMNLDVYTPDIIGAMPATAIEALMPYFGQMTESQQDNMIARAEALDGG